MKIRRWVFDKNEKIGDCFKNAMSTFADGDHTIALMVTRTHEATSMDFIVKNVGQGRNEDSGKNQALLKATLQGNFPGSEVEDIESDTTETKVGEIIDKYNHISILMNSPSEYSKDYITQGLDKLLDGVVPESNEEGYTVVFLAESISMASIREILTGYEQLATAIHPFLSYQFNEGTSEDSTQSESETLSNFSSVSNTISKTHSVNFGINAGTSNSSAAGWLASLKNIFNAATSAISGGLSAGYGYSWGTAKTDTTGESQASTKGSSISFGKTEGATYTYQSYTVSNLLNRLENVMKGISESQATGLWKYATYILAEDSATCTSVASYLRGITQGKESHLESSAIQTWCYEGEGSDGCEFSKIKDYVRHFCHPIFVTEDGGGQPIAVTPTNYVATDKLSNVMIFPRKSMQGLPVLEGVSFGRDPHGIESITEDFEIGFCYHMFTPSKNRLVKLSRDSLTSHTFVTGSTGSGKSNTIYRLLEGLGQKGVNFLVVEPAKGEYKEVLGGLPGVSVYGTNPCLTPLLRINPFSFPHGKEVPSKNIHILEHLDRLIEIFNVCWPMYAAMPAVLKEAVEKSYEDCGWNLTESTNPYGDDLYPTFADVTRNIRTIIDSSEYDAENKGAYKGALVTRLKSLTNGINGLIFTTEEISAQELFDRKVIVDLSRVGSTETKSLIMGLLVLKLQEHRMTEGHINSPLRHVTVLEEAHNLLKRTSTEQSQDSGNLLGKSVEMLANAIAEMRTYGEGFIIADQAPGLLDLSVIRNTNTKIIMRLPDQDDRELVGRAANLNDDQITELARLPVGVAAVYQNNWIEPVLCQMERYENEKKVECIPESTSSATTQARLNLARLLCNPTDEIKLKELIENSKGSYLNGSSYVAAKQYIEQQDKPDYNKLSFIVSQLFPEFTKTLKNSAFRNPHDIHIWRDDLQESIEKEMKECAFENEITLRNSILQCILQNYVHGELNKPNLLEQLVR
ncbi:MAG: ATP-binding protein [Spirochaetaceae bacterium]|nr:ATP-binding protein [Spirochaetaceae bacterium]